jgi:hypothetical protein
MISKRFVLLLRHTLPKDRGSSTLGTTRFIHQVALSRHVLACICELEFGYIDATACSPSGGNAAAPLL